MTKPLGSAVQGFKLAVAELEASLQANSEMLEKRMDKIAQHREEAEREIVVLRRTAQRESALADDLAEALESLESLFDKMEKGFDYPAEVRFAARDAVKAAIQSYKEARK